MLKALIKSLEKKLLNPRILDPFLPTNWEKIYLKTIVLERKLLEKGGHYQG
jgi:hypothetical protein